MVACRLKASIMVGAPVTRDACLDDQHPSPVTPARRVSTRQMEHQHPTNGALAPDTPDAVQAVDKGKPLRRAVKSSEEQNGEREPASRGTDDEHGAEPELVSPGAVAVVRDEESAEMLFDQRMGAALAMDEREVAELRRELAECGGDVAERADRIVRFMEGKLQRGASRRECYAQARQSLARLAATVAA